MKENSGRLESGLPLIGGWIGVTTVGWVVSLLATGTLVHSWSEWRALVAAYFLNGALIGTIVGLGQAAILGSRQVPALKWTLATVAAYAVGLPAGVLLFSALVFWHWPAELPMLAGHPGTFMTVSLHQAALGGTVLGLGQWLILRDRVVPSTATGGLLWILGNILGLGVGGFLAKIIEALSWLGYFSYPVGDLFARAIVGAILGLITGAILVILRTAGQPQPYVPTIAI